MYFWSLRIPTIRCDGGGTGGGLQISSPGLFLLSKSRPRYCNKRRTSFFLSFRLACFPGLGYQGPTASTPPPPKQGEIHRLCLLSRLISVSLHECCCFHVSCHAIFFGLGCWEYDISTEQIEIKNVIGYCFDTPLQYSHAILMLMVAVSVRRVRMLLLRSSSNMRVRLLAVVP